MRYLRAIRSVSAAGLLCLGGSFSSQAATEIDKRLAADNQSREVVEIIPGQALDDLAFLRKSTIDIIGRIPTFFEIQQYQKWPKAKRRSLLLDRLLKDKGFADRWTVFYADLLRIRSRAEGGNRLLAYVHKSIEDNRPWDEMARELIAASGSTGNTPSVGFLLADDSDPMTMAGATAQVFLGVRMACAQCHNHPFDKWRQKQFYELASFFGKTKQVESRLSRKTYVTEGDEMNCSRTLSTPLSPKCSSFSAWAHPARPRIAPMRSSAVVSCATPSPPLFRRAKIYGGWEGTPPISHLVLNGKELWYLFQSTSLYLLSKSFFAFS